MVVDKRCLAVIGAALALSACGSSVGPPVDVQVECSEHMPCQGELTVEALTLVDDCRYGHRTAQGTDGFGAPGDGETYLEVEAQLNSYSTQHPDGVVLLDELRYVDPDSGESVRAPLALACAEADDGRVFWTKNVQPTMSADIYQPYVVPEDITEVVVEGQRIAVPGAVSPRNGSV